MTNLNDVVAKVLQINNSDVKDDSSPRTVGAWTSLRHLEVVVAVQGTYGVTFTPREIRSVRSVRDLRELLRTHGVEDAG